MRREATTGGWVSSVVSLVLVTVLAAGCVAASPAHADEQLALSDTEKKALLLEVIQRFVPHAEEYWRDETDPTTPWTGSFDAVGPGVTQPRGAGNMALAYATLLVAEPGREQFGGVPRAVLLDHVIQSIRHEAHTNVLAGGTWGGGTWQAALETYGWAFAARLVWDELDAETRAVVEQVVTGEADILLTKPPATATAGDTGAEDNAWNSPLPALAAVMFPDHPNRDAWEERAKLLAINSASRAADENSTELVDGRPVSEWVETVNLFDDFTLENHGFFNPIYLQVTHLLVNDGAVIYEQAGHPIPEAMSFRYPEVWRRVLGPLAADDGDLVMPAGQDWTSKDYQHLEYLAALATRLGRADASVAESRALKLVARRQATHANGAIIGQPQLGYESHLIKRLTMAWWSHELFGPSPQPSAAEHEQAREETAGVHEYPDAEAISARQRDALVTMSWDDARPMGLVVPAAAGHADDPILSAYVPGSAVGSAAGAVGAYSCDCRERFFSTAGTIGARRFSMTSFADGVTMLLDRGEGRTFTFAFERIPGLTGERPVHSEGGTGIGPLSGNWANVADRFGLAVAGGSGMQAREVQSGNPHLLLEGSVATGTGNRGAAVYPLADAADTDRLGEVLLQPQTPEDWSALFGRAPDGTGRLAVARWGGPLTAELELTDPRGAPVTERTTSIAGNSGVAGWELDAPASTGETVRFFVAAEGAIEARTLDERHARLTNDSDMPVAIEVTHVGTDDGLRTRRRTLAPGESTVARQIGDRLVLAGPEWEPLSGADEQLTELRGELGAWRQQGRLSAGDYARLRSLVEAERALIERAIDDVDADEPNLTRATIETEAAKAINDRLRAPGASEEVRQGVDAARREVNALLEEALFQLSLVPRLTVLDEVMPGEPARVRTTMLNRGAFPIRGKLEFLAPAGWAVEPAVVDLGTLVPGETSMDEITVTAPTGAPPGDTAAFTGRVTYTAGGSRQVRVASAEVTVVPVLLAEPRHAELPLATGGWNRAEIELTNRGSRQLDLTLTADAGPAITTSIDPRAYTLGPGETRTVPVELRATGSVGGSGELAVQATTTTGIEATARVGLRHSDNLARNGLGAPWPTAAASSNQAAFPPAFANDGDPVTFWVAAGTQAGDGPSPARPQTLSVDFGVPVTVGEVTVVPRINFGPRAYTVEVSGDGQAWTQVAAAPSPPNAEHTTALAPVEARMLRLVITDSYDRVRPPRNVQVAELIVRAPGA